MPGESGSPSKAEWTRATFAAAVRDAHRIALSTSMSAIAALFLVLILIPMTATANGPPNPLVIGLLFVALVTTLITVLLAVSGKFGPKVCCPHCEKPLLEGHLPVYALVTRRCVHCQSGLFHTDVEGEPHSVSVSFLLSRAELDQADAATKARTYAAIAPNAILGLAGLVLGLVAVFALKTWVAPRAADWGLALNLGIAILGTASFAVPLWTVVRISRIAELHAPKCPQCGEHFSHRFVLLATGHCTRCGSRILRDSMPTLRDPDEPPAAGFTRTDLQTEANAGRAQGKGLVGILSVIAVWATLAALLMPLAKAGGLSKELVIALVLGPVLALVGVAVALTTQQLRGPSPRCSDCSGKLRGPLLGRTLASGRCFHCGTGVLSTEDGADGRSIFVDNPQ